MAHIDQHRELFERHGQGKKALQVSGKLFDHLGIQPQGIQKAMGFGIYDTEEEREQRWLDSGERFRATEFHLGGKYQVTLEDTETTPSSGAGFGMSRLRMTIRCEEEVIPNRGKIPHVITLDITPGSGRARITTFHVDGKLVPEGDSDEWPLWMHDRAYEYAAQAIAMLESAVDEHATQNVSGRIHEVRDITREIVEGADRNAGIFKNRIHRKNGPPLRQAA
jgi:hypothetical protein